VHRALPICNGTGVRFQTLDTKLDGPLLIAPKVIGDERGFFCETYRRNEFMELGIEEEMAQDNHSRSSHGIVRGMHFQIDRGAAKLVRCGRGHIQDVIVDIRRGSPTFGQWEGFDLTEDNMHTLYVPVGFAHGFCVVSDIADVFYKQDRYFAGETERGIKYDDPALGIEWAVPAAELKPSERDGSAPTLADLADDLPFVYRPSS
jgi:dTDP-4-dehydrorhamnose 3,5-epimerase